MTTHEVLVKAFEALERNGWQPKAGMTEGAPLCVFGALMLVGGLRFDRGAVDALTDAAGVPRCLASSRLVKWNDRQRSFASVKAAFCRAIEATAPEPDTAFLSEPTRDPVPA